MMIIFCVFTVEDSDLTESDLYTEQGKEWHRMYRIFPGEIPDLLSTNYTRQPLFTSNPNPNCNVTREGNNSCKKEFERQANGAEKHQK